MLTILTKGIRRGSVRWKVCVAAFTVCVRLQGEWARINLLMRSGWPDYNSQVVLITYIICLGNLLETNVKMYKGVMCKILCQWTCSEFPYSIRFDSLKIGWHLEGEKGREMNSQTASKQWPPALTSKNTCDSDSLKTESCNACLCNRVPKIGTLNIF